MIDTCLWRPRTGGEEIMTSCRRHRRDAGHWGTHKVSVRHNCLPDEVSRSRQREWSHQGRKEGTDRRSQQLPSHSGMRASFLPRTSKQSPHQFPNYEVFWGSYPRET